KVLVDGASHEHLQLAQRRLPDLLRRGGVHVAVSRQQSAVSVGDRRIHPWLTAAGDRLAIRWGGGRGRASPILRTGSDGDQGCYVPAVENSAPDATGAGRGVVTSVTACRFPSRPAQGHRPVLPRRASVLVPAHRRRAIRAAGAVRRRQTL